jgi:hypothetical protein
MKIVVFTDVHGDIAALDAALGRLRQMGCDPSCADQSRQMGSPRRDPLRHPWDVAIAETDDIPTRCPR